MAVRKGEVAGGLLGRGRWLDATLSWIVDSMRTFHTFDLLNNISRA